MACPKPPQWRPITAVWRPLWLAANLAIEQAYKGENGDEGVLVGSDFEGEGPTGREIRLPSSSPKKEFGDILLSKIRSIKDVQRKPDIVDFRTAAFYEIKPIKSFQNKRRKCIEQHLSLFRMAEEIRADFNENKRQRGALKAMDHQIWTVDNCKWKPPAVISLPGMRDILICTELTSYGYSFAKGLVIYELWKRVKQKQENERAVASEVRVVSRDDRYRELIPAEKELIKQIGSYDPCEPIHIVIVPKHFDDALRKRALVDQLRKSGALPHAWKRDPRVQPALSSGHSALLEGAIFVVAVAVVAVAVVALAPEAAAAGGTASLEAGSEGAKIIPLFAKRLMATAVAETLKKAAGVIFILGTVKKAEAEQPSFSKVGAIRVIPLTSVAPFRGTNAALSSGLCITDAHGVERSDAKEVKVGDTLMFDSEPHYIAAILLPLPNDLCGDDEADNE